MIGDEVFAFVIIQGKYKAALRMANRTIMRQVVYYCFQFFVVVYRAVLLAFRARLLVEAPMTINFTSHRAFANIGQTYESAFLLSVVQQLQRRIDGNKRLCMDNWLANEENEIKAAFARNDTAEMYKIIEMYSDWIQVQWEYYSFKG